MRVYVLCWSSTHSHRGWKGGLRATPGITHILNKCPVGGPRRFRSANSITEDNSPMLLMHSAEVGCKGVKHFSFRLTQCLGIMRC
jgi:hypothetical protein